MNELRIRHIGNADDRAFREIKGQLIKYAESSASDDEARIAKSAAFVLGATKDEVLDRLFGMKSIGIPRRTLESAYDTCEAEDPNLNPRSAYGMTQGLTRISQNTPYADERVAADRAAGRVMSIAF